MRQQRAKRLPRPRGQPSHPPPAPRALGPLVNYACTALKVSVGANGQISFFLRERNGGTFGNGRWFLASPSMQREMLATALSAITTNMVLEAALDSTDEFTTLTSLAVARD